MSGKKEKEKRKLELAKPTVAHFSRVHAQLTMTIDKLKKKIRESQDNKMIPADYSLGFLNGLIFVAHQISGRTKNPEFLNRTGSIGSLPKPVALRTDAEITSELGAPEVKALQAEIKFLEDQIITQARGFIVTVDAMEKDDNPDTEDYRMRHEKLTREFSLGIKALKKAVKELEATVTEKLEVYREEKEKQMAGSQDVQQETPPLKPLSDGLQTSCNGSGPHVQSEPQV